VKWIANLLIGTSLLGLVILALMAGEVQPPWVSQAKPAAAAASQPGAVVAVSPLLSGGARVESEGFTSRAAPILSATTGYIRSDAPGIVELLDDVRQPIDHITIPAIGLDAEVVAAALVQKDGALSWEIPAHRAGHADGTAGAGALGNAVLLGHVSSLRSGDVFKELESVAVGERITVRSGREAFTYRVVEAKTVDRADTSMVQTTTTASLTLFTCTGVWLPTIWDYTHRFVLRAELLGG
jgi:LPXTG-site transpeptidase (sortase) family protein